MRILSILFAGLIGTLGLVSFSTSAAEPNIQKIAAVNQNKAALAGHTVSVTGKVVKVNNGIMGRNFIHVQDGTGDAKSKDLLVTSQQTATVGDQVTVTGVVVVNRDFGAGYSYAVLLEDARIAARK